MIACLIIDDQARHLLRSLERRRGEETDWAGGPGQESLAAFVGTREQRVLGWRHAEKAI
jgi:hypothetical protein